MKSEHVIICLRLIEFLIEMMRNRDFSGKEDLGSVLFVGLASVEVVGFVWCRARWVCIA